MKEVRTRGHKLNLGCGRVIKPGWVNHDIMPGDGVDLVFDLEKCGIEPFPFETDSVSEIRARI